jgi:hypothetical protein
MSNISQTDIKRDPKEVKRDYMREYMKEYRKKNTEYYEKEKKYITGYLNNKYNTDPEYRQKKNETNLKNYHIKRQQILANAIPV